MEELNNSFNYKELLTFGSVVMMIVAFASVVGVVFVVMPLSLKAFDMEVEIESLEYEFATLSDKVTRLEGYRGVDYESRLNETLLTALPDRLDVPYVIDSLRTLADESELTVEIAESRSNPIDEVDAVHSQQIEMRVTGPRDKWELFVEQLHNLAPIVRLEKVELRYESQEEGIEGQTDSMMVFTTSSLEVPELDLEEIRDKEIPQLGAEDDVLYEKLRTLRVIVPDEFVGQEGSSDRNPFVKE